MTLIGLRVTDPETARVAAIRLRRGGQVIGTGCLISDTKILTCKHVLEDKKKGDVVYVQLVGVTTQPTFAATIEKIASGEGFADDLALLILPPPSKTGLTITKVEFATMLRHGGKSFSTLGFPTKTSQGRHTRGTLNAADGWGLVQMDSSSPLLVEPGFSGAPVWCPEVGAFTGIVVAKKVDSKVAWCIPSRILSAFLPDLPVRFRILPMDRPVIHDYELDDPNVDLFGRVSSNASRILSAKFVRDEGRIGVKVTYQCTNVQNSHAPTGVLVTFVTHPVFAKEDEDAYELFEKLDASGKAEVIFFPGEPFTVAAVGDAGATCLTFDLSNAKKKPKWFK